MDEKTITCLGFRKGVRVKLADRKHSWPNSSFFRVNDCEGCAFEPYCKRLLKIKTGKSRIFEIQPHHAQLKQQARDLLLSPEGIELRVNRSCQVEGAFGVLKQNMQYTRFRRRTLDRVTVEFALTCLGMNIRKYIRFSIKNSLPFYWKAPEDLAPETFKKPSARRIINRLKKRKKLQPNEIAKKGYKKKGKC
ncbi:transposase [Parasutterella excrementihominis]|uniref:transposase n=1 Tax=Parasutterella excrementihominis TaxID=487175 RepID=UPI00156702E5